MPIIIEYTIYTHAHTGNCKDGLIYGLCTDIYTQIHLCMHTNGHKHTAHVECYDEKLTAELQISATLALITLVTFNADKITANAITATQFLLFF